ncbi:hypothetical protein Syun_007625 [Stephania yunnanensis]|uniref:Uncharacterized protein n=1 Tax=Stephania yunnanensis TaxID=152371 RepID=A0AAP0L0R7_9MAGN
MSEECHGPIRPSQGESPNCSEEAADLLLPWSAIARRTYTHRHKLDGITDGHFEVCATWSIFVPNISLNFYQNQNQHLRCLRSPSYSRHGTSKTLHHLRPPSSAPRSRCSSSHFAFGLFLARIRPLVVSARASRSSPSSSSASCVSPRPLVVAPDYATSGLLLGLSTSRDAGGFASRGARPIAHPFSSPALPSPLSCFRPIIHPNPITANETYASASQPLPARYACGETPLGQHNPIPINATNASASQPLPALLSMMDSSLPIPRISPKSRVKIPIVRGRGDRRGGRGVSRTMHQ